MTVFGKILLISGNVALPFRWGEYALWALPAGSRVAVDGRFTTAYSRSFLDEAWRFMSGEPGWDALLQRYPTDIVITHRTHAPARLRSARRWPSVPRRRACRGSCSTAAASCSMAG